MQTPADRTVLILDISFAQTLCIKQATVASRQTKKSVENTIKEVALGIQNMKETNTGSAQTNQTVEMLSLKCQLKKMQKKMKTILSSEAQH